MTKYNTLNVKWSNSQLNKLKSAIKQTNKQTNKQKTKQKKRTKVTLNLS